VARFDPTTLSAPERARILTRVVAPRPIAVVSTLDTNGVGNLAPFSFFTAGGSNPWSCVFSTTRDRHGHGKHTLANIEATGEYVINVATAPLAQRINQASFEYDAATDEFDAAGLTRAPSTIVRPPRVAESPVALECRLHQVVPHGDGPGAANYIIGEIVLVHADDAVCVDGLPDERLMQLVARLGADRWARLDSSSVFDLPRPTHP
jgi:flavin reductase (DIM6/NTAB) family NADH-FMN oxidoreductase RutF